MHECRINANNIFFQVNMPSELEHITVSLRYCGYLHVLRRHLALLRLHGQTRLQLEALQILEVHALHVVHNRHRDHSFDFRSASSLIVNPKKAWNIILI